MLTESYSFIIISEKLRSSACRLTKAFLTTKEFSCCYKIRRGVISSLFGLFASSSLNVLFKSTKLRKFCHITCMTLICFLAYLCKSDCKDNINSEQCSCSPILYYLKILIKFQSWRYLRRNTEKAADCRFRVFFCAIFR